MSKKKFFGLVQVLRMPQLSPSMATGKIRKWQAKVTEPKNAYDLLVEIEPDRFQRTLYWRRYYILKKL